MLFQIPTLDLWPLYLVSKKFKVNAIHVFYIQAYHMWFHVRGTIVRNLQTHLLLIKHLNSTNVYLLTETKEKKTK